MLGDIDAVVEHLRAIPEVDMTRIAISGVCQTGRQPILMAAKRDYISRRGRALRRYLRCRLEIRSTPS